MIVAPNLSTLEQLALLPEDEIHAILDTLPPETVERLLGDWSFFARPKQVTPPGTWNIWLILAGRGWGKTQTGAQWVKEQIKSGRRRGALVGPTGADVRDVMVEGPSGIIEAFSKEPKEMRPVYEPGRRRIRWPNGALCFTYSAEEPNRLRGPQHDFGWGDELAAWQYPDAYDQMMFGMRLGHNPRTLFTTTPKPVKLIRDLVKRGTPDADLREGRLDTADVVITKGSTYENIANLARTFIHETIKKYEGTTLGRQELYAEILEDIEGALWHMSLIEAHRVSNGDQIPTMKRIVVAADPAVTSKKESAETGIIVAGLGVNDHAYVFRDASGRFSPNNWGKKLIELYENFNADRVIGETNNGGELIETVLRNIDPSVSYKAVTASRGKARRAEPIVALYEQGRVHHVGYFGALESQMTTWREDLGMDSPDRMDALVWALTELMIGRKSAFVL